MEYMSPGMKRAWLEAKEHRIRSACKKCGLAVPKYAGAYPKTCKLCGHADTPLEQAVSAVMQGGSPQVQAAGLVHTDQSGQRVSDAGAYPRRPFDEPPFPPKGYPGAAAR